MPGAFVGQGSGQTSSVGRFAMGKIIADLKVWFLEVGDKFIKGVLPQVKCELSKFLVFWKLVIRDQKGGLPQVKCELVQKIWFLEVGCKFLQQVICHR